MEQFLINGGKILNGEIFVEASKNAYLPILAASALCDGEVLFENAPGFSDIENMCKILSLLGLSAKREGETLLISGEINNTKVTHEYTQKLRASVYFMGVLLAKFRQAIISYPGGCKIGTRPVDIHISALKSLGAKIIERHGYIYCYGQNMQAGKVVFSSVSVGATENLILACCLLKGVSTLYNAAKEPEIVELARFLNSMGADIRGAGTDIIEIRGVERLHGGEFKVMPDRIIAGTHLILGALCGKRLEIVGARRKDNQMLLDILNQSACQIEEKRDRIIVSRLGKTSAIKFLETLPFPNFPTDLQAQIMVLAAVSNGTTVIRENIFENRMSHVMELVKMGADIFVRDRLAIINGVEKLYGAEVYANDLRAGAALVIAGLIAEGYTTISGVDYIDRGYFQLERTYEQVGADIKRIKLG